jgi:hypothetical protein
MNAQTHYQTSFSIRPSESFNVEQLLSKLKLLAWQWVTVKERKHGNPSLDHVTNYQRFTDSFQTRSVGISSLETASFYSDEGTAWAMKYSDKDMNVKGRFWHTEIGMREQKDKNRILLSANLSFSVSAATELDLEVQPPAPSIPYIVKSMLNDIPRAQYYFSEESFPVQRDYCHIHTDEECRTLVEKIRSSERTVAFIVFFGATREAKSEAGILARALMGKANVFVVEYTPSAIHLFDTLKFNPRIIASVAEFSKCRIFLPFRNFGSNLSIHRAYNYNRPEFNAHKNRILSSQLSKYNLVVNEAVCSIEDIRYLIRSAAFKKLKEKSESKTDEAVVYEKMIEELENKVKNLKDLSDSLELQKMELEDRLEGQEDEYKEKIHSLCQQHDGQLRKKAESRAIEFPQKMPASMDAILRHARALCPNLIITDRAIKSAEDHNPGSCDKAWEIIHDMENHLHRLKFVDKVQNIDKEFKDVSRFEYAKTEGPATKADTSLATQYQITHDGRTFEIWSHIIYETNPKKLIRVYFAFDEVNEKIIIGHFGPHLKNATSRTI